MSFTRLLLCIAGLSALLYIVSQQTTPDKPTTAPSPAPPPPAASCKTDWALCTDNADLANHYDKLYRATAACKTAAEDRAKYGSPQWPWFAFGSFVPGTDAPKTGIVTLVEGDAKFQNGFGAMVRSRVACKVNLRSMTVTDVQIRDR